ncbi:indoleacetamide hydrolase [Pseudorhodoferax sp.]|uniref:indoleacetamide hydrolase n=1 Tax=Pseudorhodoferax sp. TaxID=1993553 RepID=UPI002DD6230C|nr:indoleacetamide hydrolase [Pseudorhodoferax sp.]
MAWITRSAVDVRDALASRQLSCAELVSALIVRTDAARALNCYVAFDAEGLLAQARAADARLAAGERLPLLGVPVALKDNIDAAGLPCGNGTGALHGRAVHADAELVRRLRAAGALITGKLGMHELAFGITSNNAVTGAVHNPWDAARMPGGSSGGSGAAVAARLVPVAIGTDTGGSVRVPAALCGVAGLRPTVGRVSADGIAPISATRDTAGPLARCVADLALFDGVLSGDDTPLPDVALRGLRLGLPQPGFWDDLEPGVRGACEAALATLRDAGVTLVPVPLPGLAECNGEVSFVVALFEFVRDLTAYLHDKQRGVGFADVIHGIQSPDVKALASPLLAGGAVPEAAYRQALQARARLQALYREAFASHGVEALVFPTTPRTAARIGEDETVALNGRQGPTFATFIRNTDPGSNAAIPGLSLPVGLAEGLPVGLALDGPAGSDRRLLAIGRAIEAALPAMPAAPLPD